MANYTSLMRTSHFRVKDLPKFKSEIEEYNLDITIEESFIRPSGTIVITGSDFAAATVKQSVLDAMDEDEREEYRDEIFSMFEIIQNHLAEGESVLINSIGNEKFRYLVGESTIITRQDIVTVNMEDAVRKLALDEGLLNQEQLNQLECTH